MKKGRASQTAAMVALFRALAHSGFTTTKGFSDPTARAMLTGHWKWMLQRSERRRRKFPPAFQSGIDLLALRTLEIDAHLVAAVEAGAEQVVILGAGLDGRAHRLSALSRVPVFEVDHPATQRFKRERVAELPITSARLTYVPVDFERDPLVRALADAGQDATKTTAWVWEGVVMYLSREAFRASLAAIAERSAPGSTLVLNYHERVRDSWLQRILLGFFGEPQIGRITSDELDRDLRQVGFERTEDHGVSERAEHFGATRPQHHEAVASRIAVARRRA